MKNILIFFIFLIVGGDLFAQRQIVKNNTNFDKKRLHFGFTVGVSTMDFSIKNSDIFNHSDTISEIYSIQNQKTYGFLLGPISNLRLGEYFDLRVLINFNFGQRNLNYLIADSVNGELVFRNHIMQIASTYMEFPILIKYKAERLNNFRPYIIAGINPKYDLAARKKINEDELPKLRLNRFDVCYDLGLGSDFYLPFFKLSVELKISSGLKNLLVSDGTQYSSAINKLQSHIFYLSFHFE